VNGMSGTGPNKLTCVQTVGPQPETCNGKDDDCNNVIDDNLQDPRVGVVGGAPCQPLTPLPGTSFPAGGPAPPCDPGKTACVNGAVVCQGRVGPEPNLCDGISRDCSGQPNSNGNCPTGFVCYDGNCVSPCGGGEFPCPGGFVCVNGLCINDGCTKLNCPPGQFCRVGTDGTAKCEDPCMNVTCPANYRCKDGVCVDDSCRTFGCPTGQRCDGTPPTCVNDPCYNVTCETGKYCNPAAGGCVDPCPEMCPPGQACVAGTCQGNPCAGLNCRSIETCVVTNGTGMCVENLCRNDDCGNLKACCGGTCIDDPCVGLACPDGSSCTLDSSCRAQCAINATPPKVEIVGAGGGGFSCAVAVGGAMPSGEGAGRGLGLALLGLAIVGLALRRRARGLAGVLVLAGLTAVGLGAAGCKSDPYCLNCENGGKGDGGGGGTGDLAGVDLTPADGGDQTDLMSVPDGGPCVPTNGAVEKCDGIDNDCNGVIDDVAADKLLNDPNNCGACGNACTFNMLKRFGACVGGGDAGAPRCVPTTCLPGYVNIDPNDPGCSYQCTPTTNPTEICDGKDNDCNGKIDDPFTTTWDTAGQPNYDKETANCGGCGLTCTRPGAVAICKKDAVTGKGFCGVDHCINTPNVETYRHNPARGDRDVTGCEYRCPVASTTTTSGSNDCDNTSCSFPQELCNGLDDNCNFVVDDPPFNATEQIGGDCGQNCPGGLVANCVGTCQKGSYACVNGVRQCQNSVGPTTEICDGKDNDCNGKIDDPFTATYNGTAPNYDSDPANCGACGGMCNLANAVNKCEKDVVLRADGKGTCKVLACKDGFSYPAKGGTNCTAPSMPKDGPNGVGCYYTCPVNPSTTEICDGKDNDCNGCVDDGMATPPLPCNTTQGVCAGKTIPVTCRGAQGWRCDYSGVPGIELDTNGNLRTTETLCDNQDGNCNGVIDRDGFPTLTNGCNVGLGVCRVSGTLQCGATPTAAPVCRTGGFGSALVVEDTSKKTNELCDGKDNDCDGKVDERTDDGGFLGWRDTMAKVGSVWVYTYEASRIDASASSQGGNAARACSTSNKLPWSNVTQAQAAAACAAVTNSAGQPMRLCTATEWQAACVGPGNGSLTNSYSYSSAPSSYTSGVCNDLNALVTPAVWATGNDKGLGKKCYSDFAADGRVYDASGNLSEWTSTSITVGSTTYYKARGGSYTSPSDGTPPDGTSCQFDFVLYPGTFINADVGFRCCSDAAP